jgi:hypothetical protein
MVMKRSDRINGDLAYDDRQQGIFCKTLDFSANYLHLETMFLEPQTLPARNPLIRGGSTKSRDVEPTLAVELFVEKYTYIYGKEPDVILTYCGLRDLWHDWRIELRHK